MKKIIDELKNIEEDFFELNQENKTAYMKLQFDKVSDVFDVNAITKTPVLSDDFTAWVKSSFDYAPRKYKIHLDVSFNDLEGYDKEELKNIFTKNIFLEAQKALNATLTKNRIAFGLIALGVSLFAAMLLVKNLWEGGGLIKNVVEYVMDIGTTVTFWEAMTILIVENKEKRDLYGNLIKRYDSINFHEKTN